MEALIVSGGDTIGYATAAWIHSKSTRSGSQRTERAYRDTLTRFRYALQNVGLDLDSDPARVADVVQVFCSQSWGNGEEVSAGTFNQRAAIISSFYQFAHKRRLLSGENPVDLVERRPSNDYDSAHALEPAEVADALAAIDRTTLAGKRDYALLATALYTGRRLSELLNMTWGDISWSNGLATVTFPRAKGAKKMIDQLPASISRAILEWTEAAHKSPTGDTYLWVSVSNNSFGRKLSKTGASQIVSRHLGTTKFHTTRHTMASAMEQTGAPVSEIQQRLGHSNLATTSRYLQSLKRAQNQYGGALASLLGIE